MTDVCVIPIVEGVGECDAVPVLIRRIALDMDLSFVPRVPENGSSAQCVILIDAVC